MPEKENSRIAVVKTDDIKDAIRALAEAGYTDAAKLLWEKNHYDEVEELKYKLFGI